MIVRPLTVLLKWGIPLLACLALMGSSPLQAQVDNVYVFGTVKDHSSAKKIDGVVVTVFKNGGKLMEVISNGSGKYEVNLDYGSDYKLVYSKPGLVSKNLQIDTRNVPEEERVGGHGMNIDMTMFNDIPEVDFSVLNNPIGKAKFYSDKNDIGWDLDYTATIQNEVNRLIKEYNDKKKNEADALAEYARMMQQGEASMTAKDYKKAVEQFNQALGYKPGDAKANARLSDAKMKLDDIENEKKRNEQYAGIIKEADAFFTKKEYENARGKYQQASAMKELEAYPKNRIKECDTLIADAAKKAEEERKLKELEEKYKAAITAGDLAMKGEKYEEARTKYMDASALKPTEQYPKDQIALIATKLEELAKKAEADHQKKELEAKYQAAIVAADAAFKATNYEQAKAKYTEALGIKPEEKYPKDQLAAIDKKLEELAKKAEEERKKRELDQQYQALITAADGAFRGLQFEEAKGRYNEALVLKPAEKYPKDQLAAIEKKIAELAKKAEEERLQRELDGKYQAAITAADGAFRGQEWEVARGSYNEAVTLKPKEKYPKDQLLAIDKAIAELARKAEEERLRAEKEARYQKLIEGGNEMFGSENYEGARARFVEASTVKPDERYPKEKITDIDARLAELKRIADEEKRIAELEARYTALITQADKSFGLKKYPDALNNYKDALQLKPAEAHPRDRIVEIENMMDAAARAAAEKERLEREAREKEQRYAELIRTADKAFLEKRYTDARPGYVDALTIKPGERHPEARVAEIDRLLEDLARKAEEDRLRAERDAAEAARLDAERLRKLAEKNDVEAVYRELVAAGDLALDGEKYDMARDKYTAALGVKPEERYPKDRLAEIEELLARRQRDMDEAARLAEEQRRLDEERRLRELQDAEATRLTMDDERRRLDELKAIDERYRQVILEADAEMGAASYQPARDLYTQALDIKPQETYPQAKIEQIDKLLADLERKQREAALAAQKGEAPDISTRKRKNTSIDNRAQDDAERFMRESREREEAEKYERIKRSKQGKIEQEVAYDEQGALRREAALMENERTLDLGVGLYQGNEDRRQLNAQELEALKLAYEASERARIQRANMARSDAYADKLGTEEQLMGTQEIWKQRHDATASEAVGSSEELRRRSAQVGMAALDRTNDARTEAQRVADQQALMQERGNRLSQENSDRIQAEKERQLDRTAALENRSADRRSAAQEEVRNVPDSRSRDFADYNRGKLAQEYPEGVTEESYTEGNKVIIKRIVVNGNRADEYSKVIARWGIFYFKNGQSISEDLWRSETEGGN